MLCLEYIRCKSRPANFESSCPTQPHGVTRIQALAISPKRPGSAGGSVASSVDQEVEWREDFGLKTRRR